MPTFARTVAALLLAGLFWLVSEEIKPLLPEQFNPGWFSEINAAIAAVVGWIVSRGRIGGGYVAAPGLGLTLSICGFVAALLLQSFAEVIRLALDMRYRGATDALMDTVQKMIDNTVMISTVEIWVLLLGGGIVIGYLAELTHRTLD